MATPQHRCVFVGNIPYDATEEQLIEICQEVGPVVSFRLLIDRETGKPKGYGFCEYKDEETALSARRNLQGYEINGRQLRVDFAENDKTSDRSREQGRGGPGLAPSVDPLKQASLPMVLGDSTQYQPMGLQTAMNAAAVLSGSLGGAQAGMQGQMGLANDPLTLHLAKLSRNQLNGILSDMKVMATQNKEVARQLLLGRPQLSKALFQAQVMLGMVTPQVLQMPNLVETSGQASQPPFQDTRIAQVPVTQLHALPPLAQSSLQSALLPRVQEGQVSTVPQSTLARSQIPAPIQPPMQPRAQLPLHINDHALQQAALRGNSPFFPIQPHSSSSLSIRPQIQVGGSSLNQQIRPSSLNNLVPNAQMVVSRPSLSDTRYQPGPSASSGIKQPTGRSVDTNAQVSGEASWAGQNLTNSNLPLGRAEKKRVNSDPKESVARPSKMMKQGAITLPASSLINANGSTTTQILGNSSATINAVPKTEAQRSETQPQLPSGVESALLQQVMNLTPEQLNSLSPEQKQQVIQLQQMLRREQT